MNQKRAFSALPKSKSDWQLFTNDGKFDSKLPPYQRLLRKKTGCQVYVIPIPKSVKLEPEKPLPQIENVENYVLVWLDQSMGGKGKCDQQSKHQLQQVVNSVKIFINPKACEDFMSKIKDEKIFVIISGAVEEDFVSSIHEEKQLESIYVYCPDKGEKEPWYSQYTEISGIYNTISALCKQLDKDVTKLDYTLLGFDIMEQSSTKDVSNASQQEASFMYDQLFRDIVLKVLDEDMQDMYDFCHSQYWTNAIELSNLKELKRTYSSNNSIYWYTRNSFLYRMLNKALRTHDYDTLYTLRVYIRHLHQQIVIQQETKILDEKMLYRGQVFEKDEFKRLRENEGGLLSFSSFLSTTSDREVALRFAHENLIDSRKVTVLFEITIEKNTEIPVADVSKLSYYKTEKEWLFSMGSVFRIGKLKDSPEGIWIVPLKLTDEHDKRLISLKEHFQKSMKDSNVCLNFASLMYQLAAWKKSEYFYYKALQIETFPQRRSALYNNLAMVKDELGQYDEALDYYNKSLQLETGDKATTYNNIATLYRKKKEMDKAIEYYEKAIEESNAQGNHDEELLATLHGNIAGILNEQGKHEEALEKCQEALKIKLKIFPEIHPAIATANSTIASTMHHLKLYQKAVEYAEKAVKIDKTALRKDHPQTLLHQNNLEAPLSYIDINRARKERKLVRSILRRLKKSQQILRVTDKSGIFHIGHIKDYEQKAEEYRQKTQAYVELTDDPSWIIFDKVVRLLNDLRSKDFIRAWQLRKMMPNRNNMITAYLYFIPKPHKEGTPLRPIVSSMNIPTTGISKFLDQLLRPLSDKHVRSTTIIDGVNLVRRLKTYVDNGHLKPTTYICTFDITDLYTMLQQEQSLNIRTEFLLEHGYRKVKGISMDTIRTLARLVITENVFVYEKKIYRQVIGGAMGSAFTLTLANVFMWKWEKDLVRRQQTSNEIYGRYIDDIFFTSNGPLDTINQMLDKANSLHPNIRLVRQIGISVSFLDVLIENKNGILETSVYRKEAAEPYVVSFNSDHFRHTFRNIIDGALVRAIRYSSTLPIFNEERRLIKLKLLYNA